MSDLITYRERLLGERRLLHESIADYQAQADGFTRNIDARYQQMNRLDRNDPERTRIFDDIQDMKVKRQTWFNTINEIRDRIRVISQELGSSPRGPFSAR